MYVVTGASGNTGSVIAHHLLQGGKQVRVIGRSRNHLQALIDRGAEPFIADITDSSAIARAFEGAEAVYAMIPPNVADPNVYAYEDRVNSSIVSALRTTHVQYAVVLSSIGADKESGTGPVLGLHRLEKALDNVEGLNSLHLRAGYFMENVIVQVQVIQSSGNVIGPVRGDLKIPMIETHDIGVEAANALLQLDFKGRQTRELLGQRDISYTETASIIGKAIGKPGLKYVQASDDQLRPIFVNMGMSPNMADLLLEMSAAMNSGHMKALEPRTPQNTTPTSFEQFVQEKFVPLYLGTQKAA